MKAIIGSALIGCQLGVSVALCESPSAKSKASAKECYSALDRRLGLDQDFLISEFTDLSKRSVYSIVCKKLIQRANKTGGDDNITVILVGIRQDAHAV